MFNDRLQCQLIEQGIAKFNVDIEKESESEYKKRLLNKLPIVERNKIYSMLSYGSLRIEELSISSIEKFLNDIKKGSFVSSKSNYGKARSFSSKDYGSLFPEGYEKGLDGSLGYGQSCRDSNGSFGSLPSYDDYE